jgi:hypothetical protein
LAVIWLGMGISIKLIFWPLVIWLIFIKHFKAAAAAIITFIVSNLVGATLMGPKTLLHYYLVVGQQAYQIFGSSSENFSITGLAWRIFSGTNSETIDRMHVLPLVNFPALASILAPAAILVTLAILLFIPMCRRDQKLGFVVLLTFCVLASPVTWNHYFVLLSIPLAFAYDRLITAQTANRNIIIALLLITLLLIIPTPTYSLLSTKIAELNSYDISADPVPFWIGIISYVPAFCVMTLILLTIKLGKQIPNTSSPPPRGS